MLQAIHLSCEHLTDPVGVPAQPRFSWILRSDARNVLQTHRRIQVAGDPDFSSLTWDSGRLADAQSVLIAYDGPKLSPESRYWWRVQLADNLGQTSPWSAVATFVTDMAKNSWQADFVSAETEADAASSAGTLLRSRFAVRGVVKRCLLHATALGVYRMYLNGRRVSDWAMTPGWTDYPARLQYQTWDVTDQLLPGENAVGAAVGAGWYKGNLAGWLGRRNVYGRQTALSVQISLLYEDGRWETIATGPRWTCLRDGPVRFSEIYDGEIYDARKEPAGWAEPAFDDSAWTPVRVLKARTDVLTAQDGLPVRRREVLKPRALFIAPNGERIVDFGQNLTGWVRLTVRGKAGDVVAYSHAEVLDKDGNFFTDNLRSAKQQIRYTLGGAGEAVYEPFFTFQGFRYIRIDQFPGDFGADNFEAVAAHSDMPETGAFACSDARLNRLLRNIRWSMKDNFFDIPSDCPQRDERLGWTGDAHVFVRAACYLHDISAFFRKWLRDMRSAQNPNGCVPTVVPDILTGFMPADDPAANDGGSTGWGDAGVICPFTVYRYAGDLALLRENYPMMKGWIEYIRSVASDGLLWDTGKQLGDWLALDAKEGSFFGATPNDLVATAYYAYSTELLAQSAELLGEADDARQYRRLREDIGAAFVRTFFSPDGRLFAQTQTAHVLALAFGLTPSAYRARTVDALVALIRAYGGHLSTGFLGTPYLCHVLSENGRTDCAYDLLLQPDYPGWLYPLTKDATTTWEHWDSMKPDGSMWSMQMNSFNHYAYGAVADWMFGVIGGLDTDASQAGFRHSRIAPQPGGGLSWAKASQETPYGHLSAEWTLSDGRMTLRVSIPHNTSACIVLPAGNVLDAGGLKFSDTGDTQTAPAGSGQYAVVLALKNKG